MCWFLQVNHDLNKENVSTSLEEKSEVLVSGFLPSERACLATTPQPLEHCMDFVSGNNAKGKNQLACVVFMLMTCLLLALQSC